jgi:hypothetical protein
MGNSEKYTYENISHLCHQRNEQNTGIGHSMEMKVM